MLTNPPFGGTEGRHIQQNFPVEVQRHRAALPGAHHQEAEAHARRPLRHGRAGRDAVPRRRVRRGQEGPAGAVPPVRGGQPAARHLCALFRRQDGAALLPAARPGGERNPVARHETWYYELPLPEGLKKFSKGSPIQDEHFAEARAAWAAWRRWLDGDERAALPPRGRCPRRGGERGQAASADAWVETADDLKARGYDLSARNPVQAVREALPHPAELTARLLERTRELTSILEGLHEMVSNGQRNVSDGDRADT